MTTPLLLDSTSSTPLNTHLSPRNDDVVTSSNYLPTRLAAVEVSLIFQCLASPDAFALARSSRSLHASACEPFSWRHAKPITIATLAQVDEVSTNAIVTHGQVPTRFPWPQPAVEMVDSQQSIPCEVTCIGQLKSLRELDCTERRGLGDSTVELLLRQPSLTRSLSKVWLGGFHNRITGAGLKRLCQELTNLQAISLDHIRDDDEPSLQHHAEADGDEGHAAADAVDADSSPDDDLMSSLLLAPHLRSLQITRWMAEELTPASLLVISRLSSLRSLFLENLEAFSRADLRAFFSSAVFGRLECLTLAYVHLTQMETFLAFFDEADEDSTGVGAGESRAPAKGCFDSMHRLRTLQLVRCRNIHRLVPQLVLLPNVETIVFRGLLDSWGTELPKRGDLMELVARSASKSLDRVIVYAHTSTQADLDNYRAQVGAVHKVDFRDGNAEGGSKNPIEF